MNSINSRPIIEEDEIDLREIFVTIAHYKWSIIFFTLLITTAVAIKVYLMPKYYKSTVMLEVKTEDEKSPGLSLGGAGALLGMGGTGTVDLEKDVTLLKTFRINKEVLNQIPHYMVRYFIKDEKHKEVEVEENISITITDIKIDDYKNYGMKIIITPINNMEYQLSFPSILGDKAIGIFHYSEIVETEKASFIVNKLSDFNQAYIVQFSGTQHYIYDNIITPNLTVELDKSSPFITISFIDNLPQRGERYLKNLIEIYTKENREDIKEDASIIINSYDRQIKNIALRVDKSSRALADFKQRNNIIAPTAQASGLIQELTNVEIQIAKNHYKENLLKNIIYFVRHNKNIDAIAPSLLELQDTQTISLIKLIQEYQLTISNLLLKYNQTHPKVINTKAKIVSLKKKISSNLHNLQTTLKSKTASLNKMLEGYRVKLKSTPQQEQKLIDFSRDYQLNAKLYTYLIQKRSEVELKRDKDISRFRVIESIYTADKPVKPKKALIVIVAFITSLIFMILVTFFRNFLKTSKEN